ncbi:DUF1549 domain-containing protein [Rhodopirellula sallentina]|uniref:Secreted protein containing DUF1549 n=1 Tax=Rhodopirellula sallentina SM41 TaxID=1263870 RepID=M5TVR2_9BACT|nr:DUF1549 domain-containing protein [Rhodopirellula sallentina]EMI53139.1 secreted protein containing DUF1549 [Rhodopirellula sallentina SM41]
MTLSLESMFKAIFNNGVASITPHRRKLSLILAVFVVGIASTTVAANENVADSDAPSFRRDVMPVFFRAGCNAGSCHGAASGKDGFMLSLFGYDPKGDYHRTVNEMVGRRVNTAVPEQSLLLLKSTGKVAHTGGKLFDESSEYYETLYRWIAAGAPDDSDSVPDTVEVILSKERFLFEKKGAKDRLRVGAIASDGSKRLVTSLARFHSNNESVATIDDDGIVTAVGPGDTYVFARYNRFTVGVEVIVLPPAEGFDWPDPPATNYIDQLVYDRLQKLRITPSGLCDDETFLRRVTLDLAGRTPTVDEYREFMDGDRDRAAKIDELLANDEFADLWTALWAEQLRIIGGNYAPAATHVKAAMSFYEWIRKQMRSGRPLNEFVEEMVVASGSNLTNGPANLYTMMVHAPRFEPKVFAADFSQVFLGVQIQCAECHNHPFDRWTQDDYYSFVSFFAGMKRKPGVEPRERRIFYDTSTPPMKHVVDKRPMPPRVLGGVEPVASDGDPRKELAKWLTSPDNKMFSRNIANRIWAQLLGKGIVEPVDDIRVSNPPVNGPLLDAISDRLVESGFDLRTLVRDICNSRVYQLSVQPNASNKGDTRQFSHAYLRHLRADVLLDSVATATGMQASLPKFAAGTRAINYFPISGGDTGGPNYGTPFFKTFGRSSRATICACETDTQPTLSQALHLAVGETIQKRLWANGEIRKLVASKEQPEQVIEELFVRTLSRQPTAEEVADLVAVVGDSAKDPKPYEDIFWGLFNSTEFSFNH